MMVSVEKLKFFIITYDDGTTKQVLRVPHELYNKDVVFQKYVTHTKCLDCNLEFNFQEDQEK